MDIEIRQIKKIDSNTGRQFEFDVAKTIAVLFMVIIHVFDNMTTVSIMPDSAYYIFINFLGGPMAAPMFMFALGVGMVYTRHSKPKDFAIRGLKLILLGYALNFFRETLLIILANVFSVETVYQKDLIDSIGGIDILQFAGVTFLIIAFLKKLKLPQWAMLLTAFLLQGFGILMVGRFGTLPKAAQYIFGLLFYTNEEIAFPALLWLVYPAVGICAGGVLQGIGNKNIFYAKIAIVSTGALIALSITAVTLGYDLRECFLSSYYIQNLFSSMWILSIVGISISAYYYVSTLIKGKTANFVKFVSANLTVIYIAQWLLITYSIAIKELIGLPAFNKYWVIPIAILYTVASIGVALFLSSKRVSR
jgi:uncharacterized membrane protein